MRKIIKFQEKKFKIFFYILFFKNFKNAACDVMLQGFVNEIKASILFICEIVEDGFSAGPKKSLHFL